MVCKNLFCVISLALFVFIGNTALAACPSADVTGDCFVDYEDFAQMGGQWLNGYDSNDLTVMAIQWLTGYPNMAYIPGGEFEMGDHHGDGWSYELPVHPVLLDSFFMGTCEITNQQYCVYLNDANSLGQIKVVSETVYASSDSGNSYPYCDTHSFDSDSQIDYSGGVFSVRSKGGRDMSDDPMVEVSWYGAVAYCNWRSSKEGYQACYDLSDPNWLCDFSKQGYRLATEAEWEYAARGGEHSPYYRFPWGDMINHDYANYWANGSAYSYDTSPYTTYTFHPDWNDGFMPYTSVVGTFSPNGYGLYDMAGNVWEWCNDWNDSSYYSTTPYPHVNPEGPANGTYRILRSGSWSFWAIECRVALRYYNVPDSRNINRGFRIVLSD